MLMKEAVLLVEHRRNLVHVVSISVVLCSLFLKLWSRQVHMSEIKRFRSCGCLITDSAVT